MEKNIMKRAWEIARAGQATFGGKVREYLSESLKIAWKESRMVKVINITEKYEAASQEEFLKRQAERKMSESRMNRAKEKYAEFMAQKSSNTDCFFLFGKTFPKKEELKAAGWTYNGNSKVWWSREDLEDFGFMKISA